MRITIRHGGVLKCDAEVPKTADQLAAQPGPSLATRCPEQFTSYSAVSIIRAQAAGSGWGRVWAWQVTGDMAATARIKQDVCPDHNAVAQLNAQRREEIVKAQREQAKETKAAEKLQKEAAGLAEKTQRDNARAEKKLAKQKSANDRKEAREMAKADRATAAARARTYRDALLATKAKKRAERLAAKLGAAATPVAQLPASPATTPEAS